ncbi:hypothetical protein GYB62_00270 [bacterium]|nr:hypothetical protein [bacterium]
MRDILRAPEMAQVAQRVSVEYHIEPLSWQETANYIRHRLQVAAADPEDKAPMHIFDSVAIAVIYYFSGGVPRLINTLCDYALVHAYAMGKKHISYRIALEVVKGRSIGGINRFRKDCEDLERVRVRVRDAVGIDLVDYMSEPPAGSSGSES